MLPYSERRALLEEIAIESQRVRLVATFEDGEALFAAVCARGSRCGGEASAWPLRVGRWGWVKTKKEAPARFAEERERGRRVTPCLVT